MIDRLMRERLNKLSWELHEIATSLPTEPRFGEWISVDNPPKVEKYGEVYILVTDGESITNGVATNWDDDDDEVRIHGRFPIDDKDIKWWMPLPKLPKGEKK